MYNNIVIIGRTIAKTVSKITGIDIILVIPQPTPNNIRIYVTMLTISCLVLKITEPKKRFWKYIIEKMLTI